jgi:RNA polymerase sigma-70 factor, ECF subfamily
MNGSNHYITADEVLMHAVAAGDEKAFEELYRRYGQKLFGYFYKMLWGNREQAEDCVQELFLRVIRYKGNYDADRKFSTWLYSIAFNICKNEYRKQEMIQKVQPREKEDRPVAQSLQAEMQVDMKRFAGAVKKELQELDEEKKTLFILRFEEQYSVPEISRIMNIPEGTVKSRIFYLLKLLSGKLKTYQFIQHDT